MNISVPPTTAGQTAADAEEMGLVAKISVTRVTAAMDANPACKSMFNIVGLDKELTCLVARKIEAEIPNSYVRVHTELNDGTLRADMLTDRNTTDFRNMPRADGGGCIVFATPTRDLDTVGATAGEIAPLSLETLASSPSLWIDECPELRTLAPRLRDDLTNFALGIHRSGVAVGGLRMIARFFLRWTRTSAEWAPSNGPWTNCFRLSASPAGPADFAKLGKKAG